MFLKKISRLLRDTVMTVRAAADFFNGTPNLWTHGIIDHSTESVRKATPRIRFLDLETSDTKRMKRARAGDASAVREIKHDANLLGLVEDPRTPFRVKERAIECIRDQGLITCLSLSRDVTIALSATQHLYDQNALTVVLRHSPHTTVRKCAARLSDDASALLFAAQKDPEDDVQREAHMRYTELFGSALAIRA